MRDFALAAAVQQAIKTADWAATKMRPTVRESTHAQLLRAAAVVLPMLNQRDSDVALLRAAIANSEAALRA